MPSYPLHRDDAPRDIHLLPHVSSPHRLSHRNVCWHVLYCDALCRPFRAHAKPYIPVINKQKIINNYRNYIERRAFGICNYK